jgi:superfamily II DNA or RNA helicase
VPQVQVTLTNRTATIDADEDTLTRLKRYWSYSVKGAYFSDAYQLRLSKIQNAKLNGQPIDYKKLPGWDGRKSFVKNGRVPAGLFRATKQDVANDLGIQFKIHFEYESLYIGNRVASDDERYEYQDRCIDAMCENLVYGGGLVLSSTGTGKTAISGKFAKCINVPILFVVDQINLLEQAQQEISQWLGEPVGYVGDSRYDIQRVTVATIQTLHKRANSLTKWFKTIGVVIIDEIHEQMAKRNFGVINKIKPIAQYGLTATLGLKKKDIRLRAYALCGPVVFEFPITEGQKRGVLTQGKVLQLLFLQTGNYGDYQTEYDNEVLFNVHKLRTAVELTKQLLNEGRYVIVLVERLAHLHGLRARFENEHIPFKVAYGDVSKSDRLESMELFESGDVRLFIANKVFKKGVNIKRVDAIIDLAEMNNKNDPVQKFGRGVRLHPDKTDFLYIDVGTQSGRFGTNATSRRRAFLSQKIPIKTVSVSTPGEALRELKLYASATTTNLSNTHTVKV